MVSFILYSLLCVRRCWLSRWPAPSLFLGNDKLLIYLHSTVFRAAIKSGGKPYSYNKYFFPLHEGSKPGGFRRAGMHILEILAPHLLSFLGEINGKPILIRRQPSRIQNLSSLPHFSWTMKWPKYLMTLHRAGCTRQCIQMWSLPLSLVDILVPALFLFSSLFFTCCLSREIGTSVPRRRYWQSLAWQIYTTTIG